MIKNSDIYPLVSKLLDIKSQVSKLNDKNVDELPDNYNKTRVAMNNMTITDALEFLERVLDSLEDIYVDSDIRVK